MAYPVATWRTNRTTRGFPTPGMRTKPSKRLDGVHAPLGSIEHDRASLDIRFSAPSLPIEPSAFAPYGVPSPSLMRSFGPLLPLLLIAACDPHRIDPPPPPPAAPATASTPLPAPSVADPTPPRRLRVRDGATMLLVPAGPFVFGSTQTEGQSDERPQRTLRLSTFYIDRTEVTVAQYRTCLSAGACSPAATERFCNLHPSGKDDHPVNCVRWKQAADYCEWAGARLPTEAEWEKAARGTEGDAYPWGPTPDTCVVAVRYDEKLGHACGEFGTWPVGSKPFGKSPFGVLDMAGNVWEWVADWYAKDAYASAPEQDPKGPATGKFRILRGGGWGKDGPGSLRSARRFKFSAEHATPGIGFRCASSAL